MQRQRQQQRCTETATANGNGETATEERQRNGGNLSLQYTVVRAEHNRKEMAHLVAWKIGEKKNPYCIHISFTQLFVVTILIICNKQM